MINFLEVKKSVKELKTQLAQDEIDERAFEDQLLDMIDLAEDGHYWMLGHESGKWYRHDGEKWVPDDPGELFVSPDDTVSNPGLAAQWRSVNWTWFIVSLIIIAVIGAIVYYSSLPPLR